MPDTAVWQFNKNYKDHDQVEAFYADFLKVYEELVAAGQYPYNDSFKGRIPGAEGPDEDTAIYLLQNLRRLKELDGMIEQYIAEGGERIEHLDETTKFASIVNYGFYMGGTGWTEWHDARLVPDQRTGAPQWVLPKGKRTRGNLLQNSLVLVKRY
jgi:hypothetical protein